MDLAKLAQLGNREKVILGVVVLLAFTYGSHTFLIQPQRNNLKAAGKELTSKEKLLQAAQEKSKNLGKLEADCGKLEARLKEIDENLLTEEEGNSLLKELPVLVEATRNRLLIMKPQTKGEVLPMGKRRAPRARGKEEEIRLVKMPVEMNLTGTYESISDLLSKLKEREPSVTIGGINLEADEANLPQLEVNLKINLYIVTE